MVHKTTRTEGRMTTDWKTSYWAKHKSGDLILDATDELGFEIRKLQDETRKHTLAEVKEAWEKLVKKLDFNYYTLRIDQIEEIEEFEKVLK